MAKRVVVFGLVLALSSMSAYRCIERKAGSGEEQATGLRSDMPAVQAQPLVVEGVLVADGLAVCGPVKLGEWIKLVAKNADIELRDLRISPCQPDGYYCEVHYVASDWSRWFTFTWTFFDGQGGCLGMRSLTKRAKMLPTQVGPAVYHAIPGPQRSRVRVGEDEGIPFDRARRFELTVRRAEEGEGG